MQKDMEQPEIDNIHNFISHLTDEEIEFVMVSKDLPEIMKINSHAPYCKECGDRIAKIMLKQ